MLPGLARISLSIECRKLQRSRHARRVRQPVACTAPQSSRFHAHDTRRGFALAVQPIMAQTVIKTDNDGLTAAFVQIPSRTACSRCTAPHRTKVIICDRTGDLGNLWRARLYPGCLPPPRQAPAYLALDTNLVARQGDPSKYTTSPEIQANVISKVPDAQVKADLDALAMWAAKNGGDSKRLAITVSAGAAASPGCTPITILPSRPAWPGTVACAATYAPITPRHPLDQADNMQAPVLGLYGGQDQGIPNADVDAMNAKLKAAGSKSYIHIYPGRPARLPRRLPTQLSCIRGSQGRLAAHAGVVQAVRRLMRKARIYPRPVEKIMKPDWNTIDTVLLDMDGTLLDLNFDNHFLADSFAAALCRASWT